MFSELSSHVGVRTQRERGRCKREKKTVGKKHVFVSQEFTNEKRFFS